MALSLKNYNNTFTESQTSDVFRFSFDPPYATLDPPKSTHNYILEWVLEQDGFLNDGQSFSIVTKTIGTRDSTPNDLPFWLTEPEIITEAVISINLLPENWASADYIHTLKYYEYNPDNSSFQSDLDSGNYSNADFVSNPLIIDGGYTSNDSLAEEWQNTTSRRLVIRASNSSIDETFEIQSDGGIAQVVRDDPAGTTYELVGIEFDGVDSNTLANIVDYKIRGTNIFVEGDTTEFNIGTDGLQPGTFNNVGIEIGTPVINGDKFLMTLTARSSIPSSSGLGAFLIIRAAEFTAGGELELPGPGPGSGTGSSNTGGNTDQSAYEFVLEQVQNTVSIRTAELNGYRDSVRSDTDSMATISGDSSSLFPTLGNILGDTVADAMVTAENAQHSVTEVVSEISVEISQTVSTVNAISGLLPSISGSEDLNAISNAVTEIAVIVNAAATAVTPQVEAVQQAFDNVVAKQGDVVKAVGVSVSPGAGEIANEFGAEASDTMGAAKTFSETGAMIESKIGAAADSAANNSDSVAKSAQGNLSGVLTTLKADLQPQLQTLENILA